MDNLFPGSGFSLTDMIGQASLLLSFVAAIVAGGLAFRWAGSGVAFLRKITSTK